MLLRIRKFLGSAVFAIFAAVVIPMGLFSPQAFADTDDKWAPWFEFGGFYNSDDASRGDVTVFLPLMQSSRTLLFLDGRGKFYEDDVQEGNLAFGYRQMTTSGFNLGAWIGGDVRNTEIDNKFWQLSGGFEALSHNFDARLNWYGPITEPQAGGEGSAEVFLRGNDILMIGGEEVGLYGVDGELGVRVPLEMAGINTSALDLRVYGGGYYFDHEDAVEEIAGGKARAELRFNDIIGQMPGSRLTAEYEFSYDDVREERHEVGARLRIPFDGERAQVANLSPQEQRMMDGLERDTDIITTLSEEENVEDALTNTDFDRVAFVNDGGSITQKSKAVGGNSLLIVNGTVNDGTQTVRANQTVQGGGSTIQVRGRSSGRVVGFTAPGSKPTVINTGGDNVISLTGDNTHIAGLLIDGNNTGGNGIGGGGNRTNIAITQNMIQNTGSRGINFGSDNKLIQILDNSIRNTGDDGINFADENRNITIDGVTIADTSADGIDFENFNKNVTIRNVLVSGTAFEGIEFESDNTNVTIANSRILNVDETAIEFDDRNTGILISNVVIDGVSREEGIFMDDANSITVIGSTIRNTDDQGIEGELTNRVVVRNTVFDNIGNGGGNDYAIDMSNGNTVTIAGNTFGNIGNDAIRINRNNMVDISSNLFNGPIGGQLLDVDGGGMNALSGTGNVSKVPITCQSGTFTGTVTFVDGTVLQDGAPPCN